MFENLVFSDICLVNIENWDLKYPRFSNICVFDIHHIGEYRKHGCLKILDFFRSKFLIFALGEYRKHGFIKVGEIKSAISEKSTLSTWPSIRNFRREYSCPIEIPYPLPPAKNQLVCPLP